MSARVSRENSWRPVFDWAARLDRNRRLGLWIVVAVFVHAGLVILLQVTPGEGGAEDRTINAAKLYILPASKMSPEVAAFIDAENPALFATDAGISAQVPGPLAWRPSFDLMEFRPLPLPHESARVLPPMDPSLIAALAVPAAETSPAPGSTPLAVTSTRVESTLGLAGRELAEFPKRLRTIPAAGDVTPTELLVAVGPTGEVRHVMMRVGSGDSARDSAAMRAIFETGFQPDPDAPDSAWGLVRILWGAP